MVKRYTLILLKSNNTHKTIVGFQVIYSLQTIQKFDVKLKTKFIYKLLRSNIPRVLQLTCDTCSKDQRYNY